MHMSDVKKIIGARLRRLREEPRDKHGRAWRSREKWALMLRTAAGPDADSLPEVKTLAQMIKQWERGDHIPGPIYRPLYATVTGKSESELFTEALFGRIDGDHNEDVNRRTLLSLVTTSAAAGALARDAEPLRDAFETALAVDASEHDADAWERIAYEYAREVGFSPAAILQPELAADFAELTRLIASGQGTARTRLIQVAAQLAALIAINLTSLGEGRAARRWWRTSARAADQTGDHIAAALVRGRAAVSSLYTGAPRRSVIEAAEEAIAVGRGSSTGVVSGQAAKAQALAELGRHDEAENALNDLRAVFERLPDTVRAERGSQWGWSVGRLHFVTSLVHTCAGNVEPAMAAQDDALALCQGNRNSLFAGQVEMQRAGVLIRAGDIDEGARHMTRILESLPTEQRGDGFLQGSAQTSLRLVAPAQAGRPSIRQAHELLTSTGDR